MIVEVFLVDQTRKCELCCVPRGGKNDVRRRRIGCGLEFFFLLIFPLTENI